MMKDSLITEAIDTLLRICKRLIAIWVCVLMLSPVAGVSSVEKYAYIGKAAELVSNINYEGPALYRENGTYITSWKGNTAQHDNSDYAGKFQMDDKRNIWILRVEREDDGKYYVKFGVENTGQGVNITLIVKEECPDVPKKESRDSINGLLNTIMILVIMILVMNITIIVLMNKDWIRKCLKAGINWIQEKLCSKHTKPSAKQLSKSHDSISVAVPIDGSELTEHQVRNWLEGQPEFFENYERSIPGTYPSNETYRGTLQMGVDVRPPEKP